MNKLKKNLSGMTLVEVLVAMTLFAMMFAMVIGIMVVSVRMNGETQNYDGEVDEQVRDVERFNPMGAYIFGRTITTTDVSNYELVPGTNELQLRFTFGSKDIPVTGYTYQANSVNAANGFNLKFFSSLRPDTGNNRYWIRIINVSSTDDKKISLYLPQEDHGVFYQKNGTETYTAVISKNVPINTALSVGFDATDAASTYFWFSDRDKVEESLMTEGNGYYKVDAANTSLYADTDGYIDIYYTDSGFKNKTEYIMGW